MVVKKAPEFQTQGSLKIASYTLTGLLGTLDKLQSNCFEFCQINEELVRYSAARVYLRLRYLQYVK